MANHQWTDADDRRILEYAASFGNDRDGLARHLQMGYQAVSNRIDRQLRGRYKEAVASHTLRMVAQREVAPIEPPVSTRAVLSIPPAPFAVEFPQMAAGRKGKPLKAIAYGDTHYPFQDDTALKVLKAVIKDVKPDIIVNVGDLVDAWQISRFDKDPSRRDTLQDNIDAAREHLSEIAQIAPKAERIWLEGNHESRLTRAIWGMEGVARELAKLRVFQQTLTWPTLMESERVGWRFIPERDQSKTPVLPKIITKHGTVVRKASGMSARGEWERYGASGISGHTHRLGHYFHRDKNGTARWIETGCTCLLDAPYGTDFDWQQGFAVLTWNADRRLMDEHLISIRDGSALFRDTEYQ